MESFFNLKKAYVIVPGTVVPDGTAPPFGSTKLPFQFCTLSFKNIETFKNIYFIDLITLSVVLVLNLSKIRKEWPFDVITWFIFYSWILIKIKLHVNWQ